MSPLSFAFLCVIGVVTALFGVMFLTSWLLQYLHGEGPRSDLIALFNSHELTPRPFVLFSTGSNKRIELLVKAELDGALLATFDFEADESMGKHARRKRTSVVFLQRQGLTLPRFFLRPQWLGGRLDFLDRLFGAGAIRFPERRSFVTKFFVTGTEKSAICRMFSNEVMDFCEAHSGWYIEGVKDTLICYRDGVVQSRSEHQQMAKESAVLFSRLAPIAASVSGVTQ